MAKLIAYFSRAGENYFNGSIRSVPVGNTEIAAKKLRDITGADLFKIEPLHPYSDDYKECVAQARDEMQNDARPELKAYPETLDDYDTIYLGYPSYCGTMPMPVFTFLERYDFTGKTVIPFCTSTSSGLGESGELLAELTGTGDWLEGVRFRSGASEADVQEWLDSLDLS